MVTARLLSVNVGLPRDIAWRGKIVHTAVWKDPVQGRRMVRRLNIEGDRQGDLAGHGGEQRAVFVYQIDSYRYRSEEHTSELQSLMRISYAVFCLKKKNMINTKNKTSTITSINRENTLHQFKMNIMMKYNAV